MTTTSPQSQAKTSAKGETASLLAVVGFGLLLGVVAALFAVSGQQVERRSVAAPVDPSSLPAPSLAEAPAVTETGEVTPSAVSAIVETLSKDGPIADPGGKTPKPRNGALFHRMTQGSTTIRVYTMSGSPETVMADFAKDLEKAGFHRDDADTKADARGRLRRVYSKDETESLITVNRGSDSRSSQTLVTIVEEPKRAEP